MNLSYKTFARFGVVGAFYACPRRRSVSPVSTVVHRQPHIESRMDQSGQYIQHHQRQLFPSSQLPPPSQLLPVSSSYNRSNTLPPISSLPPNSNRYAYQSPAIPSSSNLQQSSQLPWPTQLSPREELVSRNSSLKQNLIRESENHLPPVKHESTEDGMPSTSDFVKKLYKMLEDSSFMNVVSWGPNGDCFVVKDMNEFTKSILPRMFKHSNFASFVRQLNKYDFHKVKNNDDNQFGDHSWTFRHPDFHADRRDALENIKRKVPAGRKPSTRTGSSPQPGPPSTDYTRTVESLQSQVDRLTRSQDDMAVHIRNLESNYQNVLNEMVYFQRSMAQQDGLMQNLIQYFLQMDNGKIKAGVVPGTETNGEGGEPSFDGHSSSAETSEANPFVPVQEAQRMMGSYPESDVARASLMQMNEMSRRAEVAGMSFDLNGANGVSASSSAGLAPPPNPTRPNSAVSKLMAATASLLMGDTNNESHMRPSSRIDALARRELQRNSSDNGQMQIPEPPFGSAEEFILTNGDESNGTMAVPFPTGSLSHEGLQVFTLGHLMPKSAMDDNNGNWSFDAGSLVGGDVLPTPASDAASSSMAAAEFASSSASLDQFNSATSSESTTEQAASAQKLRVRRSTYVPGWAVPPRVLLVEDDAVSRKLSSKFLQIFGCAIDVAVDGVGAVNKMNLEKYDLVLMDIVMPKLDGISATSMIRQFDHMTPIISMTSNSKPSEILKYYSSGMNDILPKPFTKEGLLDMLEKHLMHLKAIQQMAKVPRSVGVPPLSDSSFEQALAMQAQASGNLATVGLGGSRLGTPGASDDEGKINPLAGMGLTDEQYNMILQNLVNGEQFMVNEGLNARDPAAGTSKRSLDDVSDQDRSGKRGRFEVVE